MKKKIIIAITITILSFMLVACNNEVDEKKIEEIGINEPIKKEDLKPQFTIEFLVDKKSIKTLKVNIDSLVSKIDDPYKKGYKFLYWKDSNNNEFNFDTKIKSNISLSAEFLKVLDKNIELDIKPSYNIGEKIQLQTKQFVDDRYFQIKFFVKKLNKDFVEIQKDITLDESFKNSLIKADIIQNEKTIFTTKSELIYFNIDKVSDFVAQDPNIVKYSKLAFEKYGLSSNIAVLLGSNTNKSRSNLDYPTTTLDLIELYKKDPTTKLISDSKIKEYIESIYYLDLSSFWNLSDIFKYQGINMFINLKSLNLSGSRINSINLSKILDTYPNLNELILDRNRSFTDYNFLKNRPNLKKIRLAFTGMDNDKLISLINTKSDFESLDISKNFSPKSQWSQQSGLDNIDILSKLTNILDLKIDKLGHSSIESLKNLKTLKKLSMSYSYNLNNLDPISSLNNLNELDISYTKINNLNFLNTLKNLNILNISSIQFVDNEIKNLYKPISSLSNLATLNAHSITNIDNLSMLNNLKHLGDVVVNKTPIKTLGFVEVSNIRQIDLDNTQFNNANDLILIPNAVKITYKSTPYANDNGLIEYDNTDEISYFDGVNYIVDHGSHYHNYKLEKDNKSFYRKSQYSNIFDNSPIIGYTMDGYFVNHNVGRGKMGNKIYNIFYIEGLPRINFDMPDYKDVAYKPSDEILKKLFRYKYSEIKKLTTDSDVISKIDNIMKVENIIEKNNRLNQIYYDLIKK